MQFEDGMVDMQPGDLVNIPAFRKHRVDWTTPDETYRVAGRAVWRKNRMIRCIVFGLLLLLPIFTVADDVPKTVKELFADFDPRKDPLDSKVVREWEKDGIVYRYVTFHIGTFKHKAGSHGSVLRLPNGRRESARIAAPAWWWSASLPARSRVLAIGGYACLSINWGGREMEEAKDGDPNTDWGAVDPTQQNVPGYFNLKPGEKYLDSVESPRNNNWYLLTLGSRRGLTFLEQQPEVDPDKLGSLRPFDGWQPDRLCRWDRQPSEGRRSVSRWIRLSQPAVGPAARTAQPNAQQRREAVRCDDWVRVVCARIKAHCCGWGDSNDFHGIMDDTYRTGELIPHQNVRYAFTPHMNHRFHRSSPWRGHSGSISFSKGTFRFRRHQCRSCC
ncbi:MAG: hypothetical protein R3C12_07720 [Planctomycetaceae bacterium]